MEYLEVPGTGMRLSRLVLGTMTFGDAVDRDTAATMLEIAADAGITMLDTANGYAGSACESLLGELLAGRRDRFLIASKVGMPHPDADGAPPLSPEAIRRCVRGSLERLRTDYLDVYYLHQPDRRTPLADTVGALAELVEQGIVRQVGVSNFAAWQIAELRHIGGPQPLFSQPLYNLISRRVEEEYLEFARHVGLTNIVYNPLGGGLLTGKHRFGETPAGGRFGDSALGEMYRRRYWDAQLFEAVDALGAVAREAGVTLPELALRWLLSRADVGAVLIGSSRVEHLKSNVDAALGGALPAETAQRCDEVWQRLRGPVPAYNR
ncbi:aldo/keto reductase [Saccharomonospora sp. NPDC046836]|uniref:aldo/keto reductase n=1 Tax=Saccharomonospora sp. NPDC046836 TaxID=3156921 RepID=UPI00340CD271